MSITLGEVNNCLTILLSIHAQRFQQKPTILDYRESLALTPAEEDAFSKCISVESQWKKLEFYWVEKPSLVILYNRTSLDSPSLPEKSAVDELSKSRIQVSFDGVNAVLSLSPKMPVLLPLITPNVWVRSDYPVSKLDITAVP